MTPLDQMLDRLEYIKKLPSLRPGVYLHLGCGPHILGGYLNIDGYHDASEPVLTMDIGNPLPFAKNSVKAIYSSHSLEHLPIRTALKALSNWVDVLEPGGQLFLAVPDLEEICMKFIDVNTPEDQKWGWHIYTMFGYQINSSIPPSDKSLDYPVDHGQFHQTGFTANRLKHLMFERGMAVKELFKYDGWGTPSLFMNAEKNANSQ